MASGTRVASSSTTVSSPGLPAFSTPPTHKHLALLPLGCVPSVRLTIPDILAATPHPPSSHPAPEHGPPPVSRPHHYQPQAPPYSRGSLPPGVGDQILAPNLLPALYPPLPGHHSNPHPHPGIPVAGRGPVTTDLALAGYHPIHSADPSLAVNRLDALPDIVHSHNVGHAITPRPNQHRSGTSAAAAATRHQRQRQQQTRQGRSRGGASREAGRSGQTRRRSRTHSATSTPTESGRCKEPCVKCMVTVTSLRWVLLVLSMLGVVFVVSGIVMAALHAVGNDFLIYALVFIGLGVVLVAVVVVAWKCTPPGSEPIHALFNIGDVHSGRRERRPRRTHRSRDGQWHGGMMYPEFQYRRPPPSYAASMQQYQAQMAEAQSNNNTVTLVNNNTDDYSLPGSPPPSYRSRASTIHSGVHITFPPAHDSAPNSRPPTYRSRAESHHRPRLPMEEFEAASPSSAPGDVSFTGPVMNADTVQQIIGTHRTHRRQRSAGPVVWHTRSSSLDQAQSADTTHHRRGASLDRTSLNLVSSSTSQENQTLRQQEGGAVSLDIANSPSLVSFSPLPVASSQPSPVYSNTHPNDEQKSSEDAYAAGSDTAKVNKNSGAGSNDKSDSNAKGDNDSEPEQYNTAL